MWRQYKQVIRVMSKKLPTLPRGSLCIKYLNLLRDSSMPQQNKTRDKVGIDLFSGGFETLLCHWYDAMIIKLLKKNSEIWQKTYFQESSAYIKPS